MHGANTGNQPLPYPQGTTQTFRILVGSDQVGKSWDSSQAEVTSWSRFFGLTGLGNPSVASGAPSALDADAKAAATELGDDLVRARSQRDAVLVWVSCVGVLLEGDCKEHRELGAAPTFTGQSAKRSACCAGPRDAVLQ